MHPFEVSKHGEQAGSICWELLRLGALQSFNTVDKIVSKNMGQGRYPGQITRAGETKDIEPEHICGMGQSVPPVKMFAGKPCIIVPESPCPCEGKVGQEITERQVPRSKRGEQKHARVTEASLRQEFLQNVVRKGAASCHAERAVCTPPERSASIRPAIPAQEPPERDALVLASYACRAYAPVIARVSIIAFTIASSSQPVIPQRRTLGGRVK